MTSNGKTTGKLNIYIARFLKKAAGFLKTFAVHIGKRKRNIKTI